VFATARNPAKMDDLKAVGIETLTLDVLSPESLSACVSEVQKLTGGTLNVLVNNAGTGYSMPISDIQLSSAKQLFSCLLIESVQRAWIRMDPDGENQWSAS